MNAPVTASVHHCATRPCFRVCRQAMTFTTPFVMLWIVKIGIVTESFLPGVNGVTNSVLRILDHFRARSHEALVVAPGDGPTEYAGARVARVPAVPLPMYRSFPVALPTRQVESALRDFQPDVVHLASPAACCAMGAVAAARLDVPAVAVFQSD